MGVAQEQGMTILSSALGVNRKSVAVLCCILVVWLEVEIVGGIADTPFKTQVVAFLGAEVASCASTDKDTMLSLLST